MAGVFRLLTELSKVVTPMVLRELILFVQGKATVVPNSLAGGLGLSSLLLLLVLQQTCTLQHFIYLGGEQVGVNIIWFAGLDTLVQKPFEVVDIYCARKNSSPLAYGNFHPSFLKKRAGCSLVFGFASLLLLEEVLTLAIAPLFFPRLASCVLHGNVNLPVWRKANHVLYGPFADARSAVAGYGMLGQ